MQTWFVLDDSSGSPTPTGPFTQAELELMARAGALRATTLVAAAGTQSWIPASTDPLLAALFRQAPPTSPESIADLPPGSMRRPYGFGLALSMGWTSFTTRWPKWMVLALVWLAITVVTGLPQWIPQMLGSMASDSDSYDVRRMGGILTGVGGCIGVILQLLVGLPMFAGLIYAGAEIHEGRGSVGDIFQGFRRYGQALLAGLLLGCVYLACAVVAMIPMLLFVGTAAFARGVAANATAALLVGASVMMVLVLVLFALILMRVLHAPVIAIDPRFGDIGVLEAFRVSWRNTAGLGLSMLVLLIVVGLLAIASILLACIGYILVGVPLAVSVFGAMYVLVQRNRIGAPAVG